MIVTDERESSVGRRAVGGNTEPARSAATDHASPPSLNFRLLALMTRTAQSGWSATALADRVKVLRRFRSLLVRQAQPLAAEIARHRRCSTAEALATEIHPLADAVRFLERNLADVLRTRRPGRTGRPVWLAGVEAEVRREPFGLVLVIGPGNYPLFLTAVPALQALAAGNAVWLKPAPDCLPLLTQFLQLLVTAGLRPGVAMVLPEAVASTRAALAARPDKVVFTGSAETGRSILQQLAPQLTPATLELSGCDAVFVRDDADLDLTARALAFGITLNGGATCIAPRRVLVSERVHRRLAERLVNELKGREAIRMKSASARWLPWVQQALAQGATLLHGRIEPDQIAGPLVLDHARPEMPLLQNDSFAPVMSLVPVAGDEAALLANARCPYALGASVFSRDLSAAHELATRVRAGSVTINDLIVPTADPRLPFGGMGESGHGVTRGAEGLLEMTFPKVIHLNRARARRHYEPLDESQSPLFVALLQLTHGGSLSERFAALRELFRWRRSPTRNSYPAPKSGSNSQPYES
jgi:acyl-CoA reductase-like NAD-dependent aldehyde dehydrogenase